MEGLVITSGFMLLNSAQFSHITFKVFTKKKSPISLAGRMARIKVVLTPFKLCSAIYDTTWSACLGTRSP